MVLLGMPRLYAYLYVDVYRRRQASPARLRSSWSVTSSWLLGVFRPGPRRAERRQVRVGDGDRHGPAAVVVPGQAVRLVPGRTTGPPPAARTAVIGRSG